MYVGKRGEKWRVVVDQQPQTEYDGIGMGSISFSPDSKRFGYVALTQKSVRRRAVIGGTEGPEYERIPLGPFFSADSRHVSYQAMAWGKWHIVVDGDDGPEYDVAGKPVFRETDGAVEFLAVRGDELLRVIVPLSGQ